MRVSASTCSSLSECEGSCCLRTSPPVAECLPLTCIKRRRKGGERRRNRTKHMGTRILSACIATRTTEQVGNRNGLSQNCPAVLNCIPKECQSACGCDVRSSSPVGVEMASKMVAHSTERSVRPAVTEATTTSVSLYTQTLMQTQHTRVRPDSDMALRAVCTETLRASPPATLTSAIFTNANDVNEHSRSSSNTEEAPLIRISCCMLKKPRLGVCGAQQWLSESVMVGCSHARRDGAEL